MTSYDKTAAVITPLQPHQQRVVERIQQQPGLVVAHGLGSGKTLSSIAAAEALGGPTTVLVPAALRANYEKEIAKHVDQPQADYDISSLQRAARSGSIPKSDLLIVDEAHRLRDPSTKGHKVVDESAAAKRLLLTGTPLYNRPTDLASLVNIAARDTVLPEHPAAFESKYIGKKTVDPGWFAKTFKGIEPGTVNYVRNRPELQKILKQWVDYHENSTEGFPARKEHIIEAPMGGHQSSIYESVLGTAPPWLKYKVENKLPLSKAESKDLNAFANAVRQVAVSPGGFDTSLTPIQAAQRSPKITKAFERFSAGLANNPAHKAVVYSNYLDAGLRPYEALLQSKNIPYGKFTGEMKKKERDQLVKDYNEGRIKALLVSSAGGEGLDLKGTRQIQILDPHWNKEKLEQVIGRGIRYKSHAHLPEDQRNVDVEHYVSTHQEPGFLAKLMGQKRRGGIDEYLRQLSEEKDMVNRQIRELLQQGQTADKTAALSLPMRSALQHAAAGTALGATVGGLGGALHASPEERASGALRGALAGGALGGIGGAGLSALKQHGAQQVTAAGEAAARNLAEAEAAGARQVELAKTHMEGQLAAMNAQQAAAEAEAVQRHTALRGGGFNPEPPVPAVNLSGEQSAARSSQQLTPALGIQRPGTVYQSSELKQASDGSRFLQLKDLAVNAAERALAPAKSVHSIPISLSGLSEVAAPASHVHVPSSAISGHTGTIPVSTGMVSPVGKSTGANLTNYVPDLDIPRPISYETQSAMANAAGGRAAGLGMATRGLEAQQADAMRLLSEQHAGDIERMRQQYAANAAAMGEQQARANRRLTAGAIGVGALGAGAAGHIAGGSSDKTASANYRIGVRDALESCGINGVKIASEAETKSQKTERHLDDLGIALMASPYAAELVGGGLQALPFRGAQTLGKGIRSTLGKESPYGHSSARELAGLALVAPSITHSLADVITGYEPPTPGV